MPQFVIEREVAGAGSLSEAQIRDLSIHSLEVLKENGTADSVAAQLCHRGQGVLRLPRAR